MKFIPLLYTVQVSILIQLVQDEAILSDWKQQLERDIETMKAQSNIVSIRTVSPETSDHFYVPFLLLLFCASSCCIFSTCFNFFHLLCISCDMPFEYVASLALAL